ncbi:MAG: hypothetical protein R3C60_02050 [Parvularculaceae bacterium]
MSPAAPEEKLGSKTVQELQALAAAEAARAPKPSSFSRAAHLHLIDLLSRRAGTGFALIAGLTIFMSVLIARGLPLRAGVWTVMVFASLYASRSYLAAFRSGERISAHPFRWRAFHTASLTVVSFAFGAGAVLLLPRGSADFEAYEILGFVFAGALGAGALNAAHFTTGLGALLPAGLFVVASALRQFGAGAETAALALMLAASCAGLFIASARMRANASRLNPRRASRRGQLDQLAPKTERAAASSAPAARFG